MKKKPITDQKNMHNETKVRDYSSIRDKIIAENPSIRDIVGKNFVKSGTLKNLDPK